MFPSSLNSYVKYTLSNICSSFIISEKMSATHMFIKKATTDHELDNFSEILLKKHRAFFCRAYRVEPKQHFT